MRELRFRAWNKYHKKMYNVYELNFDNDIAGCQSMDHRSTHTFGFIDLELMQYTGLKDKNGVEIYEGDILDFDEIEWGGELDPEIVPAIDKLIGNWSMHGSCADISECRAVIGNIYENPELLDQA